MKKILVTGGCGFVGAKVVRNLLDKGYEVVVADDLSNPQSEVGEGYEFHHVDMGDPAKAEKAFKGVDGCIALACRRGAIGYVFRHPTEIVTHNNRIYDATFSAAARAGIESLVHISSSMVYEGSPSYPTNEECLQNIPMPKSIFAFSKLMGEWHCHSFFQEHQLPFTIIRPSNIYGNEELPGENVGDTHVIPDLFKKIMGGQYPLELLGNGLQTRSFLHVTDIARGLVMALESPKAKNQIFNMGGSEEIRVLDIATLIWEFTGQEKPFQIAHVEGFPNDVQRQYMDCSKVKSLLDWEPTVLFRDGLRDAVLSLTKSTAQK